MTLISIKVQVEEFFHDFFIKDYSSIFYINIYL